MQWIETDYIWSKGDIRSNLPSSSTLRRMIETLDRKLAEGYFV